MEQTLVLNSSYEPLEVTTWQRAITLWAAGKAEVVATHEREARSVSFTFRLPSVVRLLRYVKLGRRPQVQFTRANIYGRDDYTCQYCGTEHEPAQLTFDHVVPVAQGGRRGWENIATACEPCNRKKGGRTPEQAGMALLRQPRRPVVVVPLMKLTLSRRTPASWHDWLYWNVKLEEQ
jgi:5-methylcytosine-specific restriction endonuclease McrA